jgi:hypothetical protein
MFEILSAAPVSPFRAGLTKEGVAMMLSSWYTESTTGTTPRAMLAVITSTPLVALPAALTA